MYSTKARTDAACGNSTRGNQSVQPRIARKPWPATVNILSPNVISKSWSALVQKEVERGVASSGERFPARRAISPSGTKAGRDALDGGAAVEKAFADPGRAGARGRCTCYSEAAPKAGQGDNLQTIAVVIVVSREVVEEFLGKLEGCAGLHGGPAPSCRKCLISCRRRASPTMGPGCILETRGPESRALIAW